MTVRHYNASTWRVHRAREAQTIPEFVPEHVVLPGAKRAVPHDRLLAYHDQGHSQHAIVDRVNEAWHDDHADILAEHSLWTRGPYAAAIQGAREAKMQAAAEQLRKQALFEEMMAEWAARDA